MDTGKLRYLALACGTGLVALGGVIESMHPCLYTD